ncbi:MAG TPA: TRAP transporter small permease [Syntrophorhabdaceae bacterium]|nr:TRAP transporter small permease [Syntrophorhabdaceae bacterium]
MGALERIQKVINRIGALTSGLGIVLLASVGVVLVTGVVMRVLGKALSGAFDLVQILIVGAVAFAFVDCELRNRHARAEVVVERLKPKLRAWFESLTTLCALFYWVVVFLAGAQLALMKYAEHEETDMLKVPIAPFRGAWLFGLALLCVVVFIKLINHVKRGVSK